ncbi:MAG: DedA family protein, partial [Gaiellaceae bacterium]
MFQSLTDHVSGSPWTYGFLFAIAALDVIFPLVPSETSVILAGVLASSGDLILGLVIACAAGGAILGDNTAYVIGRTAGHRIVERFFHGER